MAVTLVVKTEPWWITDREVDAMIEAARTSGDVGRRHLNATMLSLTFYLGLRPREATELRLGDVSLKDRTILVRGRGDGAKLYPLDARRIDLLERLVKLPMPKTYVFAPSRSLKIVNDQVQHNRMTCQTFTRTVKALAVHAGIIRPIAPQMFRYGCGIHMARSLVAPQGIKDWLDYRTFNEVNEMISVVSRSPEDALRRFG